MWRRQKYYKYLILMLLSYLLFPLQRVSAGSVTAGFELSYDKSRTKELSSDNPEEVRSRFQQTYILSNSGSVAHRRILPYSANFVYSKGNVTRTDRSFDVVTRTFSLTSTILPVFRFPANLSYRRSERESSEGKGSTGSTDSVGLTWHLGFRKLPRTDLFYRFRGTENDGRKRDSSDYGFTLSKQAGSDLKYGRTTYVLSYKGKGAGLARSVSDSESKTGQLENSVSLSSSTFFSKRSSFRQSLRYDIRETVQQQKDEDFGTGALRGGSKVIVYSGGLRLATNPYLTQSYGFGYSFNSGPGRPDALSTSFTGKISKVISNRLKLQSSGSFSKNSTYLIRGGQVSNEGARVSGGATWKISRNINSSYKLFARRAKRSVNLISGERDSRAVGVNGKVSYRGDFRIIKLNGNLTGSISDDKTDDSHSKVLSSRASARASSRALKLVSVSGNYALTNGKNTDLRPGSSAVASVVNNVTRTRSYGASISNIKYSNFISLSGRLSITEDKSDSKFEGKSETYSAGASINYIRAMTIKGKYTNSRLISGLLADSTSESFGGNFGYMVRVFNGVLGLNFDYSAGNSSGTSGAALTREKKMYKVAYRRRLTRFIAMSSDYTRNEIRETDVVDYIEDIGKLFLNCRLGAWSLSFESSYALRQNRKDRREFRYFTRLSRQLTRRF